MTIAVATATNLTLQELNRWQNWCIFELEPKLIALSGIQQPGTFLVLYSSHKPSFNEVGTAWAKELTVEKVTKLKVNNDYRSNLEGWIIPEDLIEPFYECAKIAVQCRELRRDAIDLASKLPRNGYERVSALSPEKMQVFVELFSEP